MFLGEDLDKIIHAIIEGAELENIDKARFQTGVSVVPDFSKDNTDRNRTSPFAFTGNKFEFRAVGSSQSIAGPNTILNSILAYEMEEMADEIESGKAVSYTHLALKLAVTRWYEITSLIREKSVNMGIS